MRVVAALGGNALLRRGQRADVEAQRENVAVAAAALAGVAGEHDLVVTHGNGAQVGLLAMQAESFREVPPYPLDVLGAETQGMIGYLIVQALKERLPDRHVAVLLTQVVVDAADPAFQDPTKPIGLVYDEAQAHRLARERGWPIARDGNYFRRVVPSPQPQEIVELPIVRLLLADGALVVCAGGGGVPVVRNDGSLRGVEAVIDKDRTAALLAESIDADLLLILTDVAAVQRDWGTPSAAPITDITAAELRAGTFAQGSMGPKVDAACRFVERTEKRAAIGALEDAPTLVAGTAGTQVCGRTLNGSPEPHRPSRGSPPASRSA